MGLTDTSKFLSLILRHKPEVIGIKLDEHGWADVSELISGISKTRPFDMKMLEEIVRTDNKQRYSFNQEMADKYKTPELCNYYCSNQCPIGQQYVPEIKMKELPQIILETVASLNKMNKKQERLIEITADGIIDDDELDDFIYIQEELEKISVNVETLQLWSERMLASGAINEEEYNKRKSQKSNN